MPIFSKVCPYSSFVELKNQIGRPKKKCRQNFQFSLVNPPPPPLPKKLLRTPLHHIVCFQTNVSVFQVSFNVSELPPILLVDPPHECQVLHDVLLPTEGECDSVDPQRQVSNSYKHHHHDPAVEEEEDLLVEQVDG